MKGRRKADGEGLLTSILCDASDGLTLSERDKLSDHQKEGVERPRQAETGVKQAGPAAPRTRLVPKRRRDRGLMSVGEAPGKAGE